MTKRVMIVTKQLDSAWVTAVITALTPLAQVVVSLEMDVQTAVTNQHIDLILIDASTIETEAVTLIQSMHQAYPHTPIVVNTLSPTWRRAREAFMAGAVDYVRCSLDETKIRTSYQPFLAS